MGRIFFFGFGYSAMHVARLFRDKGWEMAGTTRNEDNQDRINRMWDLGVEPHIWNGEGPLDAPARVMKGVTHILHSLPPTGEGDTVLKNHFPLLSQLGGQLKWYGYMSTVAVYGDTMGDVASEKYEPNPGTGRGKIRLQVEKRHRRLYKQSNLPIHIFRSGAIYGPGRNAIVRVARQEPPLIHKEGHTTLRIHIEDLAQIIKASMEKPNPGSVYNCVDDLPAGPEEPLEYAYDLLGKPKPVKSEYEDVVDNLPPRLQSMYAERRNISNDLIKSELGVQLKYPTFRDGYDALYAERTQNETTD